MKYRPEFPDRFGTYQDAHAFCARFFRWYNDEHRHSGIGFQPPPTSTTARRADPSPRAQVLNAAYAAHPERFVRKPPQPPRCWRRCGSTSPSTHRSRLSNFPADLSHRR